ncbi:ATP-dependent RNA helicase ECM16 [Ascoidea rubescens DSM 1968]|uniref:RNA helicase n=1 Tax=Ascoidea rubescens DSM 1968 TaxID=1344418 RepID=A0A1D2VN66_9ASCO|nr:P-loop containing nucleoside triphosphate hydrolase protein [Ascoidea rubescens DSM 1968]ODV62995.1 P-loop containing nucleoside triphosphate hydrolase protein [Ascoidea rubescens DSM 1968]
MAKNEANKKRKITEVFQEHLETKTTKILKEKNDNSDIPSNKKATKKLKKQIREDIKKAKISSKKKKRFEKYVQHQLHKAESKKLLEKLAVQQNELEKLQETSEKNNNQDSSDAEENKLENAKKRRNKRRNAKKRELKTSILDSTEPPNLQESNQPKSSFIDFRPVNGSFGFKNLPAIAKRLKVPKKTWRERLEKNVEIEQEDDHNSSSDTDIELDSDAESTLSDEEEENITRVEDDKSNDENSDNNSDNNSDSNSDSDSDNDSDNDSDSESDNEKTENKNTYNMDAKIQFKEFVDSMNKPKSTNIEQLPKIDSSVLKSLQHQNDNDLDSSDDENNPIHEKEEEPPELKYQKAKYFTIDRDPEIQKIREILPVYENEFEIMEKINNSDCVVISGSTGSGKTTQLPQFLYESGYTLKGMIGITQPRRVATVSMSKRVTEELGFENGKLVGYQIRFDSKVSDSTKIKFMTDGVLLREMMSDFLLTKYSAIIIDEAHERNINTDILIGMLSRVIKLRRKKYVNDPNSFQPLKLIIMSATLRVSDFTENKKLFKNPPPTFNVDSRTYPVAVHFNKRTAFNYLDETFRKVCKIHRKLPKGGILIFLTGQQEIHDMVKRLKKEFPFPKNQNNTQANKKNKGEKDFPEVRVSSKYTNTEVEEIDFGVTRNNYKRILEIEDEEFNDDFEEEDEEGFEESLESDQTVSDPLHVLPLYSLLPTAQQMQVFMDPPEGSRVCIVATNIAETSITIPNIKYVVDCGREKQLKYNEENDVTSYEVGFISKASADQRSGRAGRTGPGHCYRLYSSALFESEFEQFSKPEILRMPVVSTILQMKSMGIDNILNFPFPTPISHKSLFKAEQLLKYLGAIDNQGIITELGKKMSLFPISPRFAKMLILSNQLDCMPFIVAIVSGLTTGSPFFKEQELSFLNRNKDYNSNDDDKIDFDETFDERPDNQLRAQYYKSQKLFCKYDQNSDVFKLLTAVCASDHVSRLEKKEFFKRHFLREKTMEEISKLRKQLLYIVKSITSKEDIAVTVQSEYSKEFKLSPPSKKQINALKQMITAGFIDQIAIRGDLASSDVQFTNKSRIMSIPYKTLFSTKFDLDDDAYVYIHPGSILMNCGELPPPYLVYQTVNLSSSKSSLEDNRNRKKRINVLCDIDGKALTNIGKLSSLVTYSKPLGPPYEPKYSENNINERICYVVPRFGAAIGSGGVGWDLPVVKVTQERINGVWTVV